MAGSFAGARATSGVTLLELLLVLGVLALLGLALLPGATSGKGPALEIAAAEVADALRFARSRALATGQGHGASFSSDENRLRVFRLDAGTRRYDVRDPADKKLYDISFDGSPAAGARIASSEFRFLGNATPGDSVSFDPRGAPVSPDDGRVLDSGRVDLASGGRTRRVTVASVTGGVTLE